MTHEDIVFYDSTGPKNFIENLPLYLRVDIEDIQTLEARTNLESSLGGGVAGLNDFLASFDPDFKPFQDWEHFFLQAGENPAVRDGFIASYREILGIDEPNSDWGVLNLDDAAITAQFEESFSHFLAHYPYETIPNSNPVDRRVGTGGADGTAADNFFTHWTEFLAVTATFGDSSEVGGADLGSYRAIYEAFGFDPDGFEDRLIDFYKETAEETGLMTNSDGWFIPSHSFDEWFEAMRREYIQAQFISSVESDEVNRTLVIDRIMKLLILMIDILQRIASSQASRLSFLTSWQSAYTDLLAEIPKFTARDGSPIDGTEDDEGWARGEANTKFENLLQKVQAKRSSVQDEAKQMQTTISSSEDAANQQTQIATALLQQLGTILSQIFR
ncbi:MAG: hypothetical protein WB791_04930 [Waddliaceae bacterium]